jgi:hypothetical protein
MAEAMSAATATPSPLSGADWFDPLEEVVRQQIRGYVKELLAEGICCVERRPVSG